MHPTANAMKESMKARMFFTIKGYNPIWILLNLANSAACETPPYIAAPEKDTPEKQTSRIEQQSAMAYL
jgi:hypothetical protein